ncbi:hypothetical protein BD779DRAFT_1480968 [Infundibulicybe gibba]|nr:hypothetical protein BD779DRAFT_1480968 [Infundibulicybe gibba]
MRVVRDAQRVIPVYPSIPSEPFPSVHENQAHVTCTMLKTRCLHNRTNNAQKNSVLSVPQTSTTATPPLDYPEGYLRILNPSQLLPAPTDESSTILSIGHEYQNLRGTTWAAAHPMKMGRTAAWAIAGAGTAPPHGVACTVQERKQVGSMLGDNAAPWLLDA